MDFLKKLFGGGDKKPVDSGIYLYVKDSKCGEVIRIRLEPKHELVAQDDGGYISNKMIVGSRCFNRISASFYFDAQKRLVNAELDGGELVGEDDWTPPAPSGPPPG